MARPAKERTNQDSLINAWPGYGVAGVARHENKLRVSTSQHPPVDHSTYCAQGEHAKVEIDQPTPERQTVSSITGEYHHYSVPHNSGIPLLLPKGTDRPTSNFENVRELLKRCAWMCTPPSLSSPHAVLRVHRRRKKGNLSTARLPGLYPPPTQIRKHG